MPLTTTWSAGQRKGYQLARVTNPDGPLTGALVAQSIKNIMDLLGPGYEALLSVKLPGVGWRTPGGGFIRSGAVLANLVLDPAEYSGVDWEDGSPGEERLVTIEEASFTVRKSP